MSSYCRQHASGVGLVLPDLKPVDFRRIFILLVCDSLATFVLEVRGSIVVGEMMIDSVIILADNSIHFQSDSVMY